MTAQVTIGRVSWLLSRYRLGLAAATMALLAASNGLLVLIGAVLQRIFDALTHAAPAGLGVYELIAVLVAVEIVRIAVAWGSNVVWTACWQQMLGLLRLNLLRAQMQSGGPEAGAPTDSPGEAVSRLRHDVVDLAGFIDTWIYVAGRAMFAVGSVALMIQVNPLITVAVVLPLVAMVIAARILSGRIRSHRRAYRQATAAVTSFVGEMFGAVLAIKAARAGEAVQRRLATLNDHRERMALRDKLLSNLLDAFNSATVDLSVGIVLLLAASSMHSGDFTVGDLALFASYAATLVALPHYGGRLLARHRQAGVAIERLTTLMPPGSPIALVTRRPLYLSERVPPVDEPRDRDPLHTLEVRGLTAVHPASNRGIADLDLTLRRGMFTVISGPVGAGKTTLLRALLGLMPAQDGVVSWNGVPVRDRAAFLVPPRCAYVPQVPQLFSESIKDNVLLGQHGTADLAAAIRIAVLDDDLERMPDGVATRVGARGVRLSGGQVQRTATARAMASRPDLLVLDDVSSALDVHTEHQLWDRLLTDGHPNRALLVVSNRPATIARADQVIHLHGRAMRIRT